jgi:hypothetical protein
MRGPMVCITDKKPFAIAESAHQISGGTELYRLFDVRTTLVSHPVARSYRGRPNVIQSADVFVDASGFVYSTDL